MDAQLRLLPPTEPTAPAAEEPTVRTDPASPHAAAGSASAPGWHLDADARAVGRRGVARARRALQAARRGTHGDATHAA